MQVQDIGGFYGARAEASINLGESFRTLRGLWAANGEAVGEIALPESVDAGGIDLHPVLLDGCFQVLSAARHSAGDAAKNTYLPFGWERMWLRGQLPERLICHARLSETADESRDQGGAAPEVLSGDLVFYTPDGEEVGGLSGYTVKRATRAALLSATESLQDLLYEMAWRDRPLAEGMPTAGFLSCPTDIYERSMPFVEYLSDEGVDAAERVGLLYDLERMSWFYALSALEKLGWKRNAGEYIDPDALKESLTVLPEHGRVFRRMFDLLGRAGVVEESGDGFLVKVGPGDPMPDEMPREIDEFADGLKVQYWHGATEVGLFRRCGAALADVLTGQADALTLLFSSGEPTAGDLYLKAPVARAANRMLGDTIAALLTDLPEGRRLRILEIGAGTGAATAAVLPELPADRYNYTYTDISAGFFSEAEARFGGNEASIDYRVLDIEKDVIAQGFDIHGYDLVIASNVLHATRFLNETLDHCLKLLAPSGQLIALENLRGQGWQDLTFGQLDGWWRFADEYRTQHALASPEIWRTALDDAGFEDIEVIGVAKSGSASEPDRGVILAQGPATVQEAAGLWIIAADQSGVAHALIEQMVARNQKVVVAGAGFESDDQPGVVNASVDMHSRESWRVLFEGLPSDLPLAGVVHLVALDGHGADASASELGEDARRVGSSALALVQGISDADATPGNGVWFITRGGQVLEHEHDGQLAGAMLWGLGKVVAREASHLHPRMIDLDPMSPAPLADLVNELMYSDPETHIAYRIGLRQAARLVRAGGDTERLSLPEGSSWFIEPDSGGSLDRLEVLDAHDRTLQPYEVRVAVESSGLNFWDVFRSLGLIDEGSLGGEMCGHVLEVGSDVTSVAVGDRVVALSFGTFSSEAVMHEAMVAHAPPDTPTTKLATMPTVFVSAALSYDLANLKAGERVLIHAGAGGVGLAAIQLARAAGAEVFTTASAPKQGYLRSLGVKNIFNSRTTEFGQQILDATGGEGVDIVLNSLTSEGFIEASLSCLANGGRFIELARVDIYSEEEMAAARPDVDYHILELDTLKEHDLTTPGTALRKVMEQVKDGVLTPLIHSRWTMGEAGPAMKFMRAARHIGKIVLANSALETGRLRGDRTYLVTGGLGGIGIALASWLAEKGAGAIVLNGRRDPDPEAVGAINALRESGFTVQVELADVTDTNAVDAMLERIDATLPPLAGVIHSVGVLSDAALTNQSWDSFQQVLWPKMLGAWHLHRATLDRDLDMFILFSSVAGVLGNAGQANHAAANAFLDQLAGHRRALGLPGQTIAWGAWAELGEAEEQRERIAAQLEAAGTGWITPQQGLQALEALVRQDMPTGTVAAVDWPTFAENHEESILFMEELLASAIGAAEESDEEEQDLLTQLQFSQAAESEAILVTFLQKELQAVMRLPGVPATTVGFFDLGMDSLMAVELRNRLNRAFDGEYVVSNTAIFDYPDITALARHLAEELGQVISNEAVIEPEMTVAEPAQSVEAASDNIAIIGMACRFPQANSLSEFWHLLDSGRDAFTDGRPDLEDTPAMRGAYVKGIEWFDSRFFRISPIEARTMDPQQRMLLEASWEALEDAGIDPERLRGSNTGVYAGISGSEYRDLVEKSGKSASYIGTTASVSAGRVAFALGLEGPAIAIDVACASSLAAVHQAIAGLQRGEVDLALAGGVHVVLSDAISEFMIEIGMLSRSGRSRPFDASADGYVRGEGCGMLALKRLSDAESDGDRIWAVIKGSAINQSGASAGLTVPNGPAQERVMEEALARAGISGTDVDYLEAHATGSQLGDAIEAHAIGSVYGKGREPESPLLMGTVKSNIGHLETAAGAAALIKTVLALKQATIPRHLHFDSPSPQIEWDRISVRVTSEATEWPTHPGRPARAAVSAFGISGANAHLIIEGYRSEQGERGTADGIHSHAGSARPVSPAIPLPTGEFAERKIRLLPLSAKTDAALRDTAAQYLSWLEGRNVEESFLADMAWSASIGRSQFDYRSGVVFSDAESLRTGLRAIHNSDADSYGLQPESANRVAFLYSGDASRRTGLEERLYDSEPVVRAVLDRCDAVVRAERGVSLLDIMFNHETTAGDIKDPVWAQPALYAIESALSALWSSISIRPIVVLGQGTGELAAAQAAGVFGLEDGLRFVLSRSALLSTLPGVDPKQALSGIEAAYDGVSTSSPTAPLISNFTGNLVDTGSTLNSAYWRRQAREKVDVGACAATLGELQVDTLIEIGPGATLSRHICSEWPQPTGDNQEIRLPSTIATMSSANGEGSTAESEAAFVLAVAQAYEAGLKVDFEGLFAGESRRRVSLPTYPFQRRRHWV